VANPLEGNVGRFLQPSTSEDFDHLCDLSTQIVLPQLFLSFFSFEHLNLFPGIITDAPFFLRRAPPLEFLTLSLPLFSSLLRYVEISAHDIPRFFSPPDALESRTIPPQTPTPFFS